MIDLENFPFVRFFGALALLVGLCKGDVNLMAPGAIAVIVATLLKAATKI